MIVLKTTLENHLAQWGHPSSLGEGVYLVEGDFPLCYGPLSGVRGAIWASLNVFVGEVPQGIQVGFHFGDGWKAVEFSFISTPQGWVDY